MQTNVHEALDEAWEIRKQVTQLAAVKEKAALRSIGLEIESDIESDGECREEGAISDSEWISGSGESDSSNTESDTLNITGTNVGETKLHENIVEITPDQSEDAVKDLGSYCTLHKTLSVQAYAPDHSLAMLREKQTELVCFCS